MPMCDPASPFRDTRPGTCAPPASRQAKHDWKHPWLLLQQKNCHAEEHWPECFHHRSRKAAACALQLRGPASPVSLACRKDRSLGKFYLKCMQPWYCKEYN